MDLDVTAVPTQGHTAELAANLALCLGVYALGHLGSPRD